MLLYMYLVISMKMWIKTSCFPKLENEATPRQQLLEHFLRQLQRLEALNLQLRLDFILRLKFLLCTQIPINFESFCSESYCVHLL